MIVFCFLGILFYHLYFINYDKIMTKRICLIRMTK